MLFQSNEDFILQNMEEKNVKTVKESISSIIKY